IDAALAPIVKDAGRRKAAGIFLTRIIVRLRRTSKPIRRRCNKKRRRMPVKKIVVALIALLPLTGAVQAQTVKDLLETLKVKWNTPTEPFKIIGNVYYVGTNGLASYLITSPQGHILVDTAMPEATSQIKASIEKLGFKVTDIKYLLNTHAHIDHTGGLAEMKAASGAQLVAGEADKPLLEGGYYPGAREETVLNFPPVKVDRTVREGEGDEGGCPARAASGNVQDAGQACLDLGWCAQSVRQSRRVQRLCRDA